VLLQETTRGWLPPVVMIRGAGGAVSELEPVSTGIARVASCREKSAKWRQDQSMKVRK